MKARSLTWVLLSLALAVSVTGLVWWVFPAPEPEYDGKKLSTWLAELSTVSILGADPNTPQVQAVRAIGTNAIPWLLREIRPSRSRWSWKLNQFLGKQSVIKYRFPSTHDRLRRAVLGFCALGELGEPAIPTLLTLVEECPGYVPGALAGIGRPAIPALHQCLTNTMLFTNSVGGIDAVIPGNTMSEIFNATAMGPFSRSDVDVFIPVIQAWAKQSTNTLALRNAIMVLAQLDKLE